MQVPAGATNLVFKLAGGTGDADLYVKFGSAPTKSDYDCRSWATDSNDETCAINQAQAGTYHVMVYAYKAYNGAHLLAQFDNNNANNAPKAAFKVTCEDLDCVFDANTSTDSDGNITKYQWSFGKTGKKVNYSFPSAGAHRVKLTVTDNDGATNQVAHDVVVNMPAAFETILLNGETRSNLAAKQGKTLNFTMEVPAGAQTLRFVMQGGTGDADMYIKYNGSPTFTDYDCRPYVTGNNEVCDFNIVKAGTYTIKVYAYSEFSGVSLMGNFTAVGQPVEQKLFVNDTDVAIPDNNPAGIASTIDVYRSGKAGRVKISYKIVHTYVGDLTVKLFAPQGWVTLRQASGGSADNIQAANIVNASSSDAQGTWKLQVIDGANNDVGYIDSWSVEFLD